MNTTKNKIAVLVLTIILIATGLYWFSSTSNTSPIKVKIGVVTDLSGPAAYWGESTLAGIDILKKELASRGITNVEFIVEDYSLDSAKAASVTQKIINIDKVRGVYAEFSPGASSAGAILKGKNLPAIFDSAIISPIANNDNAFKAYLDYKQGCKQVAERFKNDGVEKIGFLKVSLEFGQLCEDGISEVYGNNMISEGYNLGSTDFRTQIMKIKKFGATALINVGFEGDTANTLKVLRELNYKVPYGTIEDTMSDEIVKLYREELQGAYVFGFEKINSDFLMKLKAYNVSSPYGAALAYTHLKQLVEAIIRNPENVSRQVESIRNSPSDNTIGFAGFKDRIAEMKMNIKKY